MTGAGGDGGFSERLDWLLGAIPRRPGILGRFDTGDLVAALAGPGRDPDRFIARAEARAWLAAMRAEDVDADSPRSRRYLAILEDLFRLPAGYFRDEPTRLATDQRILFALEAAERGVTVLGPCRVDSSLFAIEDLHQLHARARAHLDRAADG